MSEEDLKKKHRGDTVKTTTATMPGGRKAQIRWDDSNMRSHHPKVLNVSTALEEISLSFGGDQTRKTAQDEMGYRLSDRIVMSPFTAKRLVTRLNDVIRTYEAKYGPLEKGGSPSTAKSAPPAIRPEVSDHSTEILSEKAGLLFQLVKNLDLEVGYERSFKVSQKTLLENRFLLGFSKSSIKRNPHERILEICERMEMPDSFMEDFSGKLPEANYVHFGLEENERTCIYKVYLEFYDKIQEEIKSQPSESEQFLLHLGFKWDVSDNTRHALTRYTWYRSLAVEDILVRLADILDPQKYRKSLEIAEGILTTASSRIPHHDILYLEVSEENNPRRSFDINMYRAALELRELHPFLSEMCQHYSISSETFHALYEQVKTKIFGHLSGGIDREGKDFLTVYYGVEGY
jgi:hypothetical protein